LRGAPFRSIYCDDQGGGNFSRKIQRTWELGLSWRSLYRPAMTHDARIADQRQAQLSHRALECVGYESNSVETGLA